MKIIYNRISRTFSIAPVLLDPNNFKETYLAMLKESDEQCALISKSKVFGKSDRDNKNDLIISEDVEIQYFIFKEVANKAKWIGSYIPRYNTEEYEFAVNIAKSALSQINKIFTELPDNVIPDRFFELEEYKVGAHKTYKYKLDKFNRFVIKPIQEYKQVRIISLMFHYDDLVDSINDPNYPTSIKLAFFNMYNDLRKDSTFHPTELRDKYNN